MVFFVIGVLLLQLAALACFVALVVEMFSHDESGWGTACVILLFCGPGQLVALLYGWTKAGEWDIGLLLLANTLCFLGGIIQTGLVFVKFASLLAPPG